MFTQLTSNSHERIPPLGQIWQCQACGKTSEDLYGINGKHSRGWDISCVLNAILVPIKDLTEKETS